MSDFVYLFRIGAAEQREAMGTPERARESMRVWLAWIRELEAKGHLKAPGQPLAPAGKVVRGSQKEVTDGPFVETKDLIAGFFVVEARDLAQAAELAKGCPMLEAGGSVEVRPVDEMILDLDRQLAPEHAARWPMNEQFFRGRVGRVVAALTRPRRRVGITDGLPRLGVSTLLQTLDR